MASRLNLAAACLELPRAPRLPRDVREPPVVVLPRLRAADMAPPAEAPVPCREGVPPASVCVPEAPLEAREAEREASGVGELAGSAALAPPPRKLSMGEPERGKD